MGKMSIPAGYMNVRLSLVVLHPSIRKTNITRFAMVRLLWYRSYPKGDGRGGVVADIPYFREQHGRQDPHSLAMRLYRFRAFYGALSYICLPSSVVTDIGHFPMTGIQQKVPKINEGRRDGNEAHPTPTGRPL